MTIFSPVSHISLIQVDLFLVLDTIDVHYMKKKVPQQKESHVWNNMKIFLSTFSLLMDRYLNVYVYTNVIEVSLYTIKQKKVLVIFC